MDELQDSSFRISVVVVAYNSAATIRETIQSAQKQQFGGFEIVVVDDGSTDNTAKVSGQLAAEDSRISVFRLRQHKNLVYSRAFGAARARGEYIIFLDPGDALTQPQLLQVICDALGEKNEVDVVHFRQEKQYLGRGGDTVHEPYKWANPDRFGLVLPCLDVLESAFLLKMRGWAITGKAFRRSAFIRATKAIGEQALHSDILFGDDLLYVVGVLSTCRSYMSLNTLGYRVDFTPAARLMRARDDKRMSVKRAKDNIRVIKALGAVLPLRTRYQAMSRLMLAASSLHLSVAATFQDPFDAIDLCDQYEDSGMFKSAELRLLDTNICEPIRSGDREIAIDDPEYRALQGRYNSIPSQQPQEDAYEEL